MSSGGRKDTPYTRMSRINSEENSDNEQFGDSIDEFARRNVRELGLSTTANVAAKTDRNLITFEEGDDISDDHWDGTLANNTRSNATDYHSQRFKSDDPIKFSFIMGSEWSPPTQRSPFPQCYEPIELRKTIKSTSYTMNLKPIELGRKRDSMHQSRDFIPFEIKSEIVEDTKPEIDEMYSKSTRGMGFGRGIARDIDDRDSKSTRGSRCGRGSEREIEEMLSKRRMKTWCEIVDEESWQGAVGGQPIPSTNKRFGIKSESYQQPSESYQQPPESYQQPPEGYYPLVFDVESMDSKSGMDELESSMVQQSKPNIVSQSSVTHNEPRSMIRMAGDYDSSRESTNQESSSAVPSFTYKEVRGVHVRIINHNTVEYRNPDELLTRSYVPFDDMRPNNFIRHFWRDPENIAALRRQLNESVFCGHLIIGDSNALAFCEMLRGFREPKPTDRDDVKFLGFAISGMSLAELESLLGEFDFDQFDSAWVWTMSQSINHPERTIETIQKLRRILHILLRRVRHVCVTGVPLTAQYEQEGADSMSEGSRTSLNNPHLRSIQLNRDIGELLTKEFNYRVKFHDHSKLLSRESATVNGHSHFVPQPENFNFGTMVGRDRNVMITNRDHYSRLALTRIRDAVGPMLAQCAQASTFN